MAFAKEIFVVLSLFRDRASGRDISGYSYFLTDVNHNKIK